MTTVRTTPPPRLPVRDKAAAQDRGWGGVSPMLTRLAAERATGVLVRERGTLHLAEGQVVHAESPSAPALDVLLSTRGTLHAHTDTTAGPTAGLTVDTTTEAGPRRSVPGAGGRHRDGRVPVDGGRPTPGALELCHLVALYDAAYFALAPSSTPGRFRYGTAEGPGAVRPVPVDALERRRCAAATCCTASGPTRGRTASRWCVPRRSPPRHSRPVGGRCWPWWTACARRRTSRGSWAGPRSTRWWTYAGWWRPVSWRPARRLPSCHSRPNSPVEGTPAIRTTRTSRC